MLRLMDVDFKNTRLNGTEHQATHAFSRLSTNNQNRTDLEGDLPITAVFLSKKPGSNFPTKESNEALPCRNKINRREHYAGLTAIFRKTKSKYLSHADLSTCRPTQKYIYKQNK